jgi:CRP-like cAMP-binding protein
MATGVRAEQGRDLPRLPDVAPAVPPGGLPRQLWSFSGWRRRSIRFRHLASLPLFERCSRDDLRRIARHGDLVEVEPGTQLLREGRTDYWFYVLLAGSVQVTKSGRRVRTLGRGEHVGEIAIIGHGLQPASAIAAERSVLFVLGHRALVSFAYTVPTFQRRLFPESEQKSFVEIHRRLFELGRQEWDRVAHRWKSLDAPARSRAVSELHSLVLPGKSVGRLPAIEWPELPRATTARVRSVVEVRSLSLRAKLLATATVLAAALGGALAYHPPLAVVRPAAAIDVLSDIQVVGRAVHPPTGRYLLLSVRIERPHLLGVGLAKLFGERLVHVDTTAVDAGGHEAFRASERMAVAAAARAAGVDPDKFDVRFRRRAISGPSGGLVYALALADLLDGTDNSHGSTIAATGALDEQGRVLPVGFVDVKSREARAARADVVLVPEGQGSRSPNVRPVATLRDALQILRSGVRKR